MRHWRAGLLKALAQFAPFRGGAAFGCGLAPDGRQMARLLLKGLGGIQVLFGSSPGRCNALLGRFLPDLPAPFRGGGYFYQACSYVWGLGGPAQGF